MTDVPDIPVRMINEYVYCPRLAYLEWVQGEWDDSAETVHGRQVHGRVDQERKRGSPGDAGTEEAAERAQRSLWLSSSPLGITAKIDLLEAEGSEVTPVEYKRGKRPHVPHGAYDPERTQLCAQGLILQEHGYSCSEGIIYFAGSRERVRVPFDDELIELTTNAICGLREAADLTVPPDPLVGSPKCPRCSLVGICLPEETNYLKRVAVEPRPLAVGDSEALPLYVQAFGGRVSKRGETLSISLPEEEGETVVRLGEVSQLVILGTPHVSLPAMHECMRRGITISWYSYGGWFLGHTIGTGHKNISLRRAQYDAGHDERMKLRIARAVTSDKISNARTLLRRNAKGSSREKNAETLRRLKELRDDAGRAQALDQLLGIEGSAARLYFGAFSTMLNADSATSIFEFHGRNRRPPRDPINALLSLAYALLVRAWTVVLSAVGLDPYLGYYHEERYGRPALALDMMEPFRPIVADSAVISAVNTGTVRATDFIRHQHGTTLTPAGRKRFVGAFERRLDHEITHPVFSYRVSYRRVLEIQARLYGRFLAGEIEHPPTFRTR
jgi:CRISPR-associated endonuclease Cas1/CRISPR-associated protein Cas4